VLLHLLVVHVACHVIKIEPRSAKHVQSIDIAQDRDLPTGSKVNRDSGDRP
jgi:hypothetical protein